MSSSHIKGSRYFFEQEKSPLIA